MGNSTLPGLDTLGDTMKARLLTALQNIKIPGDLGRGDKIDDSTFITNNKAVIKDMLPEWSVVPIGAIEAKFLLSAPVVIYSIDEMPDDVKPRTFLINKLYLVNAFLNTIWLFMDNSINYEMAFLFYGDPNFNKVDSNFIAVRFTNSSGKEKTVSISRDELRKIREFVRKRLSLEEYSDEVVTKLAKGELRVSVAFYHTQAARNSSDVAIKIANYCSVLEALFSTSSAELAHQLSERVAFFLEDDPDKRLATYRNVKRAYSIRSKIVHGAVIREPKIRELVEVSRLTDDLVRRSLVKIHRDEELSGLFAGSAEGLDEFMLRKIVGKDC